MDDFCIWMWFVLCGNLGNIVVNDQNDICFFNVGMVINVNIKGGMMRMRKVYVVFQCIQYLGVRNIFCQCNKLFNCIVVMISVVNNDKRFFGVGNCRDNEFQSFLWQCCWSNWFLD